MIIGPEIFPRLVQFSSFTSPLGGAKYPVTIGENHLCFEIIREGSVYGFERPLKLSDEGSVFCHRAGQTTVSVSPKDGYYSCAVANFEYAPGQSATDWPRCFQWDDRKVMHQFIEEMLLAYHYAALDRQVIGHLVWARLHFQLKKHQQLADREGVHPKLRLATDFINLHFAEPISLRDIAESADLSVSHLHMLFREFLKESPRQFLIQKRMRAAGHALVTSSDPIKVIAADFGYANTENFCRAFRRFFGRSASEYRDAYIAD